MRVYASSIIAAAAVAVRVRRAEALEAVGGTLCNTRDGDVLVNEVTNSRDATIFQGQDEISSGMDEFMTGTSKNGIRRGLLAFDFDEEDFPADAQVECAEIRLHTTEMPKDGTLTLHRITTAWETSGTNVIHGVNGGHVKTGDTTWSYTDFPTSLWNSRGGDYAENVVATKVSSGDIHSFGNTLRMTRIVQEWIDVKSNPFNAGFILMGEETAAAGQYVKYSGAENAPQLIPRLIVTYTSPSQGKEHRDYTAYLPEVPVNADLSLSSTEEESSAKVAELKLLKVTVDQLNGQLAAQKEESTAKVVVFEATVHQLSSQITALQEESAAKVVEMEGTMNQLNGQLTAQQQESAAKVLVEQLDDQLSGGVHVGTAALFSLVFSLFGCFAGFAIGSCRKSKKEQARNESEDLRREPATVNVKVADVEEASTPHIT